MKNYKNFRSHIKTSKTILLSIISLIFLFEFLTIPQDCFSQYIPSAGDKVIISIVSEKKPQLFETASDPAQVIQKIDNGDTLKILEKKDQWIKVSLLSGKTGWLYIDPSS